MEQRFYKHITDPVHKSIGLTEVESKLIDTRAFQRLRNIKHLGLVDLVYPGADFSRFSHSIGVCHVTGKMLDSLNISDKDSDWQLYRLAALLHDIGHYPFSHPMEQALKSRDKERRAGQVFTSGNAPDGRENESTYLPHEEVSKLVIETDVEITEILKSGDCSSKDVTAIITRNKQPKLANLVSSDLDADRIDYMLRTAHQTGLPYGKVDIEYLVRNLQLDESKQYLCLPAKAMRAVEHFLMARFFEYSQVLVHKTVAGMEMVLKDCIKGLLELKKFDCSKQDIVSRISSNTWSTFTDIDVWSSFRDVQESKQGSVSLQLKLSNLLERRPPKLIGELEFYSEASQSASFSKLFENARQKISDELNIDLECLIYWEGAKTLTKAPASISYSASAAGKADQEKLDQVVRIKDIENGSIPITECKNSVMNLLSKHIHHQFRLYWVAPKNYTDETFQKARSMLIEEVQSDYSWK